MKRIQSIMLFIMMIILVLGGFVSGCSPKSKPDIGLNTLKIGTLPLEDNLPILVAEKNGYFAEENLQVELIPFQSPVESQSVFQSGQLDAMITDLIIATLLKSAGEDVRVTSLTLGATPEEGRFAIVASPNSRIQTVADLKGKSIGISSNSIIEYVTDGLLVQGGVNPIEVNKTTVAKIPVRLEMLLNNQIDAIAVPDPHVSYTVAQGAKIIAEDIKGENLSQAVILMKKQTLDTQKEAVNGFYRAYARAVEDINKSPDQYQEILIKNVNIPSTIADTYQVQHYSKPQLPAEKEVNRIIDWLQNKNLLKNEITYKDLMQEGLF